MLRVAPDINPEVIAIQTYETAWKTNHGIWRWRFIS